VNLKDHILSEIRRITALNDGKPVGELMFKKETGIAQHKWRPKIWLRWSDALSEAGFQPNALTQRLDSSKVLDGIITACRHYGRLPTRDELELFRQAEPSIPSANAIRRHFGGRSGLITALAKRASDDVTYSDIAALLPADAPQPSFSLQQIGVTKSPEGFVYLIKAGDFYKVGRSDDLERRVKEIRIAMPDKAILAHSIRTDDPAGIEAYWHRRFADKRANGEWFKLSSLDVSAFKKRKYQ